MRRRGRITRRTLLGGSVAVAGGAAFGAWWIGRDPPNPLSPQGEAVALNPFVVMDGDGVTAVAPRAEMGQGVFSDRASYVNPLFSA